MLFKRFWYSILLNSYLSSSASSSSSSWRILPPILSEKGNFYDWYKHWMFGKLISLSSILFKE